MCCRRSGWPHRAVCRGQAVRRGCRTPDEDEFGGEPSHARQLLKVLKPVLVGHGPKSLTRESAVLGSGRERAELSDLALGQPRL